MTWRTYLAFGFSIVLRMNRFSGAVPFPFFLPLQLHLGGIRCPEPVHLKGKVKQELSFIYVIRANTFLLTETIR